jgi:hypothetical protein
MTLVLISTGLGVLLPLEMSDRGLTKVEARRWTSEVSFEAKLEFLRAKAEAHRAGAIWAFIGIMISATATAALIPLGRRLKIRAKWMQRAATTGGLMELRRSEKPLAVYLRPFHLDESTGDSPAKVLPTFEQRISKITKSKWALVALGRPGEPQPPLGAHRLYVKDHKWKELIERFIAIADLIILRPDRSEGAAWEMKLCAPLVGRKRLIIDLGPHVDDSIEILRAHGLCGSGRMRGSATRARFLSFGSDHSVCGHRRLQDALQHSAPTPP